MIPERGLARKVEEGTACPVLLTRRWAARMCRERTAMRSTMLRTAAALCAFSVGAHAQSIRPSYQYPAMPEGSGPASVQMGGSPFYFAPYLGVAVGRDDNVLNA